MTYDELMRSGHIKNGSFDLIEGTAPVKITSFGRKAALAMWAVKCELWDRMPGWESVDVLRPQHAAKWPFEENAPELLIGNEAWHKGAVKVRKVDLDVLSYAFIIGHHMHKMRFGRYSSNPRWLGFVIEVATVHDAEVATMYLERIKSMRMSYQLPEKV